MANKYFIPNNSLVKIRKSVGLVQKEFSFLLNIKRSLLGAYEEHRAEVKTDVIKSLIKKEFIRKDQLYSFMFSDKFKPTPKKQYKKTWVDVSVREMKKQFKSPTK